MNDHKKVLVLGIDALDPSLTRKYVDEGIMPNTKRFLELGAARHDLVLLGAMPTITPPMWTTLATGAYPMTHGITCFWRHVPGKLDHLAYNLDSRNCLAEPMWNVTVEAGLKTLVWHWPGSSWPPTSDNALLYVMDGTQPSSPGSGTMGVDSSFLFAANVKTPELRFIEKAASDSNVACVIEDLEIDKNAEGRADLGAMAMSTDPAGSVNIILSEMDGEAMLTDTPYDAVLSPIKEPSAWSIAVPEGAKEFSLLFHKGKVKQAGLLLKNEQGIYDHIAIYKNKKSETPLLVLGNGQVEPYFWSEGFDRTGEKIEHVYRWTRLLHVAEDGSAVKMWFSAAFDADNDAVWHPRTLYKEMVNNVGHIPIASMVGGADPVLLREVMMASWEDVGNWQARALHHAMDEMDFDVVFSHFHNVDAEGHMVVKYLKKGHKDMSPADYQQIWREVYQQTDRYIGEFLPYIEKGWNVLVVSDHGQVCAEHGFFAGLAEGSGVNVRFLEQLGYTAIKHDENGNDLREIDWAHTKAIASRANHIWINLKGRDEFGIVDPEDKYEVEEQLMTDMYGFKHPETGKRIFTMVLRNKDAALLGLSGPLAGDLIYFLAEGYNKDHACSISTTHGFADTSVSPIFFAAGPGFKKNHETERVIREVDVAPTIAALLGLRVPAQCEGAPVYQIFAK